MALLRSTIYAVVFYPATLLFVIACFIASKFGTDPMRAMVHRWTDFHHWFVRLLGTRIEVGGAIPSGAYLIAVKHQSMFETLEMMRIARTPIVVMKRELTTMPGFGWATRSYGVIGVDHRNAGAKALRDMLTAGRQAAASAGPIPHLSGRDAGSSGEMPPVAGRLRWSLQGYEFSGRARRTG